jgi:hypothetical protein
LAVELKGRELDIQIGLMRSVSEPDTFQLSMVRQASEILVFVGQAESDVSVEFSHHLLKFIDAPCVGERELMQRLWLDFRRHVVTLGGKWPVYQA